MSIESAEQTAPPPGWYPDPSGEPQWRAWNGRAWTTLTQPYEVSSPIGPGEIVTLGVLRRLRWSGLPALYVGLALLIGAYDYRPSSIPGVNALSGTLWTVEVSLGIGLILGATAVNAVALRLLEGRSRWSQWVPFFAGWRLTRTLSFRLGAEQSLGRWQIAVSLISVFIALATLNPWISGFLLLYPYSVQDFWVARALREMYS